jgi:hypothetical protein
VNSPPTTSTRCWTSRGVDRAGDCRLSVNGSTERHPRRRAQRPGTGRRGARITARPTTRWAGALPAGRGDDVAGGQPDRCAPPAEGSHRQSSRPETTPERGPRALPPATRRCRVHRRSCARAYGGGVSRALPLPEGPFFHGTTADPRVEDLLTPGFRSNHRPEVVMKPRPRHWDGRGAEIGSPHPRRLRGPARPVRRLCGSRCTRARRRPRRAGRCGRRARSAGRRRRRPPGPAPSSGRAAW